MSRSLALKQLIQLRHSRDTQVAGRKLEVLRILKNGSQRSAGAVARLHDELCFLRAYPDDDAVPIG